MKNKSKQCVNEINNLRCKRISYYNNDKCLKCLGFYNICIEENCNTYARQGKQYCCRHLPKCLIDNCNTPGVYLGYCTKHSLNKLCRYEGCTNIKRSSSVPYCVRHGGGNICQYNNCLKTAQNNENMMCRRHYNYMKTKYESKSINDVINI